MSDHFSLVEGKVFGCLTLRESLGEARAAAEFQKMHFKAFGKLAAIPLPISVVRMPDEAVSLCKEALKGHLSKPAFTRSEPLLNEGLAAIVYYFPHAPIRVLHLEQDRAILTDRTKMGLVNRNAAIESWLDLFARVLALGFVPYTPWHDRTGNMVKVQNATLGGGFCDPDSLTQLSEIASRPMLFTSITRSVGYLSESISVLLGARYGMQQKEALIQMTTNRVLRALDGRYSSDSRLREMLDPRIRAALFSDSFVELAECFY